MKPSRIVIVGLFILLTAFPASAQLDWLFKGSGNEGKGGGLSDVKIGSGLKGRGRGTDQVKSLEYQMISG